MKIYFLELYFDKNDHSQNLDANFQQEDYASETKTIKATGNDFEKIKNDIKKHYPSLRYIHLVEVSEEN